MEKLYSMNLGRGSERKGRGKVVGKVVSHESKTWFKEDRNGGKLYSINLGCGSKRKGRGKVVGKVVSHESKTWFKEDRNGGK